MSHDLIYAMIKLLYILFALIIVLPSCAIIGEEPFATKDATPPTGYNPIFVTQTKQYDAANDSIVQLDISGINTQQANLVKISFNAVNLSNTHLTGISSQNMKAMWCEVIDSVNGKGIVLDKYKMYEVTESDANDIAFTIVMDHSGSMGEERAYAVQNAVEKLILEKRDNEQFSLIKFDDDIVTESDLTNSKSELLGSFKKTGLDGFGGMTAVADGIEEGIEQLNDLPNGFEKVVLVFTDGWDNSSKMPEDSVIQIARRNGIRICAVDFGDNINPDYMKKFAYSTFGVYKHIYRTGEFKFVFDDLYNRIKNHYILEYKPQEFGEHKIYIKLCMPNDTVMVAADFNNTPDIGAIGTMAINFNFNKSSIRKESKDDIDQIFFLLKAYPSMKIELRGHTDNKNSSKDPDYNFKLSKKRAESVKAYLVQKGIDANRISTIGLGESRPIASNDTEDGRAMNRRTEFVVLSK